MIKYNNLQIQSTMAYEKLNYVSILTLDRC